MTGTVQAIHKPSFWYRDTVSCLQATFAIVLGHHGHDPLEVLGAGWEFRYLPGDVRGEEFYYPCRVPGDLGSSIARHHPVSSTWHEPPADDPLAPLAELVTAGQLPIAAVDNFHLPFRPAFHDVHAAHLVVVYGIDRERGLVHVCDPMPPAFAGTIRVEDFLSAWGSALPPDEQDPFFSDSAIGRRYLTLTVRPPLPVLDQDFLRTAMTSNLEGLGGGEEVARYVEMLAKSAAAGDDGPLREAYTFGWGMQAHTSLHGELLRRQGLRWSLPLLSEAGRQVEAVTHAWTGLRVTAAHGWSDPRAAAADIDRHGRRLRGRYEIALAAVERAVGQL